MEHYLTYKILASQNDSTVRDIRLFKGSMGPCMALYLLSKKYGIPQAEVEADKLLAQIISKVKSLNNITLGHGLSGIGWAINKLSIEECIDGDIDDILYDIDAIIYRSITGEGIVTKNLSPSNLKELGIYLVSRIENPRHKSDTIQHRLIEAAIRLTIERMYEAIPPVIDDISKDVYIHSLWDFPAIAVFLAKAFDNNIYRDKIISMIRCWSLNIQGALPYYNTNKLCLALSLHFLNRRVCNPEISKHVELLIFSTDFEEITNEIEYKRTNIFDGWIFTLFLLHKAMNLIDIKHYKRKDLESCRNTILKKYMRDGVKMIVENRIDMSFINGLSGIAIMYAFYPEIFFGVDLPHMERQEIEYQYGKRSHLRQSRI